MSRKKSRIQAVALTNRELLERYIDLGQEIDDLTSRLGDLQTEASGIVSQINAGMERVPDDLYFKHDDVEYYIRFDRDEGFIADVIALGRLSSDLSVPIDKGTLQTDDSQ